MDRDPRINPQPGDEIFQQRSRMRLRVISVTGDQVTWQSRRYGSWDGVNSWTIRGWSDVIAKGAGVVHAAQQQEGE